MALYWWGESTSPHWSNSFSPTIISNKTTIMSYFIVRFSDRQEINLDIISRCCVNWNYYLNLADLLVVTVIIRLYAIWRTSRQVIRRGSTRENLLRKIKIRCVLKKINIALKKQTNSYGTKINIFRK